MCGNRLNLYHQKFTVGGLENGLRQAFLVGMPSLVAHDSHRPIAWSYCLGLYFEPGHTRLTGYINLPETNSELETITRVYLRFLVDRVKKATDPNIETLKANLTTLLNGTETALDPRCTALVGEKLAVKRFPDIFGLRDEKHGLVPITALSPIAPGIYERDGLLLFAHQYFRRSLSRLNTLNEPFLAALQELSKEKGETVRVRLDEDMVGLASTLHEHLELQYWWGPKFSPDLKNIPDGITRHEATERDRAINGISRTEFGWHSINDLRTFECEELCDIPSRGVSSDHFGCRYIHSHLDSERKVPVHIDGAIRMYSSEKMLQRLESDLKKAEIGRAHV